ncbi:MAG: hypothetical protein ACI4TC_01280 [Kiritimatiellia bacterium]
MKHLATIFAAVLAFAAFADEEDIAATSVTNLLIVSDTVENLAYVRQPVLATADNQLIDASGKLVSFAEAVELEVATEEVKTISEAARVSLTNSLQYLYSNTNRVAKYSQSFAIAFAPESAPDNLQAYVVDESTDGITDVQWVWYSHELDLPPNRFVVYEYFGGSVTNAVTWAEAGTPKGWSKEGTTRKGWNGCHRCTVTRPVFAQGVTCLTKANDTFGGANGFNIGSMQLTVNGQPTVTGYITNRVDCVWAYFDNGVLKEKGYVTHEEE